MTGRRRLDWTAGRHWREAMALLDRAMGDGDQVRATRDNGQALVHLAAVRLLLDHPPVDVLDAYPVECGAEPPRDWRDG